MRRRQQLSPWLARWGFAALVGAAALVGLGVSATVALPTAIPGVALQAAPVYRLEVGGAIFVGLYLVAMSFVLALQNRAFTEIGTGGMRARSLVDLPTTLRTHERALEGLLEVLDEIWDLRDDPKEE
jgi:ABC-type multidrug transport system fused ATPase/permease subunit